MNNTLKNFYTLTQTKKQHNPQFAKHQIELPARILIVGGSGSGKTNTLMNLIHQMKGTFNHLLLCVKNADEPLYQLLKKKVPKEMLTICEGVGAIPELEELQGRGASLIIFDDLVGEKNQTKMIDAFIRARKIGDGCSCIYLTQTYFGCPKTIRVNCSYIFLKKLSSMRDLNMILSDFNLGIEKQELVDVYKYCTKEPLDFLMIDTIAPPEKRFRRNFNEILNTTGA